MRRVCVGVGGDTKDHVLNAMTRNTESAERWKNMVCGYTGWMSQKSSTKDQKCRMQTSHLSNTRCGPTSFAHAA